MAGPAAGGQKTGAMMFIALVLLLTLVGVGAGFTVGALMQQAPALPAAAPEHAGEPHGEDAHAGAIAPSGTETGEIIDPTLKVQPFPPVLTTLAAPAGRWVRLEGSALLKKEAKDSPELLAERAAEQILTYLRTVRLDQVEGPSGVLGLREDIDEMVRVLSDGQVQGILLHGLVVE